MIALSLLQVAYSFQNNGYATVFIFHRFGDKRYPSTSVSLEDFKREMEYLKKNGYRVVSLRELYREVHSGKGIPPKTVVITIDDGYKTTLKAFKILKDLGFPFTVFLYMEAVGSYPDFLTLSDLKEMEKSGLVDFENHLYSHLDLGKLRIKLTEEEFLKVLKKEKSLSERKFFRIFKRKPEFLAFPYGNYDKLSVKFFESAGYKLLMTQDRGAYNGKSYLVPRMAIVGSQSGFKNFLEDLKIEPLPVVKHYPDYGLVERNSFKPIFWIEEAENYKNCWIYGTKNGWVKAEKKGSMIISKRKIYIKRYATRIGIRCWNRKTNRKAEYFFLVLKGDIAPKETKTESHQ
ncbi:Polysaccharide deacetylase [Balnearium lithotrophicum]|uniref:Polysaccharide deacetylase n=1 Tax=Balnearium lithotrophicum TaxID=223788 RepID=A0A521AG81_9BACT|nr:Polysaccharide deacetylase [Balnearium lithotrophicum]